MNELICADRATTASLLHQLYRLYTIDEVRSVASDPPLRPLLSDALALARRIADPQTIDEVAKSQSFLPLYQDIIALHASTALGAHDPHFSALLLTPLSMRYPIDYRRAFWLELDGSALRQLVMPLDAVPGETFLEPAEQDEGVLGAMATALAGGALVDGSAVHALASGHLAQAWPDGRALGLRGRLSADEWARRGVVV